eukprot:332934_1
MTQIKTENTDIQNPTNKNEAKVEMYNKILSKSILSVKHCMLLGILYSFFHSGRASIYILYANQFNPPPIGLYFLLYGFCFWNGVASLLYCNIGNQYGYDWTLMINLLLQCIGVLLESLSINFWMLFVGIITAQVSRTTLIMAYMQWILPLKYSKRYTSYCYTAITLSYLLGSSLSGIISYFVSYRMVFIINLAISVLCTIYFFLFILNTQKQIEQKQLKLNQIENKDNDQQFPICLQHQNQLKHELKWYKLPKLSISHWIMLICIIYINVTIALTENSFMLFYALYVIQEFNGTVYEGTFGIVLISISFALGNLFVPLWFERFNIKNIKTILWIIIITLCVLITVVYLYSYIQSLTYFWFNHVIFGILFGILSMSSETVVLIIQPPKYAGKINGAKGLFRNWMEAITALIIVICWNYTHNALFYTIIISWIIALFASFIMLFTNTVWKQAVNSAAFTKSYGSVTQCDMV